MSIAASAPRERLPWFGHNAWVFMLTIDLFSVSYIALSAFQYPAGMYVLPAGGEASIAGILMYVALIVLVILGYRKLIRAQRTHNTSLCIRCIQAIPADPEKEITKHRFALTSTHSIFDTIPGLSAVLAVCLMYFGMQVWMVIAVFTSSAYPWRYAALGFAAVIAFSGIMQIYALEVHRRLQPWCPQCRDDDDGFSQALPEPSPDPQIKAPR